MFDCRVITSFVSLAAIILVSCSGSDSDPSSTQRWGGTLFYEAINMSDTPADQIIAETNYTNTIKDLIAECMQEKGFEYVVQHSDPNEIIEPLGLGLSREEFA